MSNELIRRQLLTATRPDEPERCESLLAAARNMRIAIGAYGDESHPFPLPLLADCMPPAAPAAAFQDARLRASREAIIEELPTSGIGVEVGTQTGAFARTLIDIARPSKMHVIDVDYALFDHTLFSAAERESILYMHQGRSWDVLAEFDNEYFDWIYVDAGHGYDDVRRDIAASQTKLKRTGYLIFNDYTTWSPLEAIPYGIMRAVNEFLLSNTDFSVAFLGLHTLGYHDLALRRNSA